MFKTKKEVVVFHGILFGIITILHLTLFCKPDFVQKCLEKRSAFLDHACHCHTDHCCDDDCCDDDSCCDE